MSHLWNGLAWLQHQQSVKLARAAWIALIAMFVSDMWFMPAWSNGVVVYGLLVLIACTVAHRLRQRHLRNRRYREFWEAHT